MKIMTRIVIHFVIPEMKNVNVVALGDVIVYKEMNNGYGYNYNTRITVKDDVITVNSHYPGISGC